MGLLSNKTVRATLPAPDSAAKLKQRNYDDIVGTTRESMIKWAFVYLAESAQAGTFEVVRRDNTTSYRCRSPWGVPLELASWPNQWSGASYQLYVGPVPERRGRFDYRLYKAHHDKAQMVEKTLQTAMKRHGIQPTWPTLHSLSA